VNRTLLSLLAACAVLLPPSVRPALAQPTRFDLTRPEIRAFVKEVANPEAARNG